MSILNLFSSGSRATIPRFHQDENHDSIDLQIKSLLYLFKRCQIAKLAHFLNSDGSFRYNESGSGSVNFGQEESTYYQKLDQVYNIEGFKHSLIKDEYRVMVDFCKNKFRSFCIVSDLPSANLSRPNSPVKGAGINEESGDFPSFRDSKDRKVRHFKFVLLPLEGLTVEFVANTLSGSDIYHEHFSYMDFSSRHQNAIDSIKKVIRDDRIDMKSPAKEFSISENEKAAIIREYLIAVAFNVQVMRIYEEYIKHHPLVKTPVSTPTRMKTTTTSLSSSPIKSSSSYKSLNAPLVSLSLNTSPTKAHLSSSPPKKLSPRKSIADLRSPTRTDQPTTPLRSKPSIAKLRLEELYNPVAAPQGSFGLDNPFVESSKSETSSSTLSETSSIGNEKAQSPSRTNFELRMDVYEKCKTAVVDKLKKEKNIISD
ncbi:hypothetical protein G9P44_002829 [Scheffersomyces stipitis]|nr:hypothetical protein G9P44_002829 [Scheffersomyces stipitis]